MKLYRHCDSRYPFLWEDAAQAPGRWHGDGEGPAHYFCDTPAGAWAEFLRHEEISEPADLRGIKRSLWSVEIPATTTFHPQSLGADVSRGDRDTYPVCQAEARRLRAAAAAGLLAPSAALIDGGARGWLVDGGERSSAVRDGAVYVLFGRRPDLVGWPAVEDGAPPERILPLVRHFGA